MFRLVADALGVCSVASICKCCCRDSALVNLEHLSLVFSAVCLMKRAREPVECDEGLEHVVPE